MDSLQREYSSDRILLSRKTHHHQEMERQANSCRTKMEIQIVDALADSGLHKDDALRKVLIELFGISSALNIFISELTISSYPLLPLYHRKLTPLFGTLGQLRFHSQIMFLLETE
jgi:hypothetical protein